VINKGSVVFLARPTFYFLREAINRESERALWLPQYSDVWEAKPLRVSTAYYVRSVVGPAYVVSRLS